MFNQTQSLMDLPVRRNPGLNGGSRGGAGPQWWIKGRGRASVVDVWEGPGRASVVDVWEGLVLSGGSRGEDWVVHFNQTDKARRTEMFKISTKRF